MLNRVISDIFHLRRVHSILPDAVLGDTLKNKLLRLSLQPSLQQLKHEQQQQQGTHSGNALPSPATMSTTAKDSRQRGAHDVVDDAGTPGPGVSSPYTIEPGALCNLLDCLAYFHLGTSAVAKEAVQLVQLSAPTMSTTQLCTTLAACCALGAQQDITATALPLLNTALTYYTSAASKAPNAAAAATPATSLDDAQTLLFSQGTNVVLLIDALQRAGVRDKEVWHLLAEHCLRYLESFNGHQLCIVVTALCAEGIDDYPDFFVAVERHITSQPSNYLSPGLLLQIVQCYKELHQPVLSLLAVVKETPQQEENLDRSISAAATVLALSTAPQSEAASSVTSSFSAGYGGGRSSSSSSFFKDASGASVSASVQRSMDAFESAAISTLTTADAQGVLELLRKCERRRLMTSRVMEAALRRLVALYYPAAAATTAATSADIAGKGLAHTTTENNPHTPLELNQLSQCLLTALEFNDATLFVSPNSLEGTSATARGASKRQSSRSSSAATKNASANCVLISLLLDAMGGELSHWYHPRVLRAVPYALRLLPPVAHPQSFFHAVVAHLRRSNDLSSHEGPAALHMLVEALLALRPYGGEATLVEYMPALTVAVLNAPRASQLELTAMVAHLPCAGKELVPGVYRQWGSQKRWLRTITEEEVANALQIMSRSGQRDSQLVHAVVEFIQAQCNQLPTQRVVEYLHQLARLGVRDLDLFTNTAEQLMRRAVKSAPSPLQWSNRNSEGREGRHASAASSATLSLAATGKQQQWQITTVHDLALLLFTFTFVLRDTIRVTQQIIARLKMCSSSSSPRDISLALYSFVKLRVVRNEEVTGQLCERASATLADFTASELASTWSSLRCLQHPHAKLHQRTLELLGKAESDTADFGGGVSEPYSKWRFSDGDCLSLGSALLLTEEAPLNFNHPLALGRNVAKDSSSSSNISGGDRGGGGGDNGPAAVAVFAPLASTRAVVKDALPLNFERHFIEVCRRLLPSASGQRLYLILCSLSQCRSTPNLSLDAWETMLKLVDTHASSLTTGRLAEVVGMAQLEVLAALHLLRHHVADVDALTAADAAVRGESSGWPRPYCPPGLWAVLRPRWRELTLSTVVQTRPSLMAVVGDIKGTSDGALLEGAAAVALKPAKGRTPRKPLVRQVRKI
jgi:hypothetical protein